MWIRITVREYKELTILKKSTVDELIRDIIFGNEIVGRIGLRAAGVLNVKEDYATFFIGKNA